MVRIKYALFLLLILVFSSHKIIYAAEDKIRIEQVQTELPVIHAYFYPDGEVKEDEIFTAVLGTELLTLKEIKRADMEAQPSHYIFLIDCSTSIWQTQMKAVKNTLDDFIDSLGSQEFCTLITFGVKVDVLLSREQDKSKIKSVISELKPDQRGTAFLDSLAKATELTSKKEYALERKLAFVFTDSIDVNTGGYTKEEVSELLWRNEMPLYSFGFDNGKKENLDIMGSISRQSGGTIEIVSQDNLIEAFRKKMIDIRSSYIGIFEKSTNMIEADNQKFILTNKEADLSTERNVNLRFWAPDTISPKILKAEQITKETIRLSFSEDVLGANQKENYMIKNAEGNLVGIRAVSYNRNDRSVILTLSSVPASGDLSIFCTEVTDVSMEANEIENSIVLSFEGDAISDMEDEEEEVTSEAPMEAWAVIIITLVTIIVASAIYSIKKQTVSKDKMEHTTVKEEIPVAQQAKVHVKKSDLPRIYLDVMDYSGISHRLELHINKTLFIGRSEICDVFFDDPDISRQHFVIEENSGSYAITNLSKTNGTYLNGILIQNTRPLYEGDRIEAGSESFIFHIG